ncbi:MAG: RdgB/HAM1 family non-canonical purine NTP pyrophosphatase [Clostridia bacterium]|nr:RdgB/HAM1 family non-canonical purine NTP pyrophosphatase [Clostridia bacterium]
MKTIVLASSNAHKIIELEEMIQGVKLLSLKDINFFEDIDETGTTTNENAEIKVRAVLEFEKKQGLAFPVLADDSGLFVNALGGEPGVHTARYAVDHSDEANRKKLLFNLNGKEDRTAYFECTLCYADFNEIHFFTGRTFGKISEVERGSSGFAYDCLFISDDLNKTFAEATADEKNSVSHRFRAVQKLKEYLKNHD